MPMPIATSPTAPPGMASRTTSAPASASPTAVSGAPPGPSPEPVREPYTTSCPAARHLPPSVPPILPVPMTAILMLAPNRAREPPIPGGGRAPGGSPFRPRPGQAGQRDDERRQDRRVVDQVGH